MAGPAVRGEPGHDLPRHQGADAVGPALSSNAGRCTTPPRTEFPYDYGPSDPDRPAPRRSLSAYLQDPLNDDGARRRAELEKNPAVVLLRQEYDRLGLGQPESLDGVDVDRGVHPSGQLADARRAARWLEGAPAPDSEANVGEIIPATSAGSDAGRSRNGGNE